MLDIEVDEFGNLTEIPLNSWEAEDYCTGGVFTNPISNAPNQPAVRALGESPVNPLMKMIEKKYYGQ